MTLVAGRADLLASVERFLYEEAWLLDERRFHAWLELFDQDARYVLLVRDRSQPPRGRAGQEAAEPAPTHTLADDTRAFLELRVRRLDTGMAHAEKPPSITRHLVANVLVDETEDPTVVHARCAIQVWQGRLETDDYTFYGKREDALRRTDDGSWRILRRTVTLDHVQMPRTVTIFF